MDHEDMSGNVMRYKDHIAKEECCSEDRRFAGRVPGIRDVVRVHGESVAELKRDFRKTMEFYFDTCGKKGRKRANGSTKA